MKILTKLLALTAMAFCVSAQAQDFDTRTITPESGQIKDGQTIELTFTSYLDWFMRVNPYNTTIHFAPLNGSATENVNVCDYQGVSVNAKTVKVTLKVPATGYEDVTDWELVIPANQVVFATNNLANPEIRVKYTGDGGSQGGGEQGGEQGGDNQGGNDTPTVDPAKMAPVSIQPNPELPVSVPFEEILIYFPDAADDIEVNPFNLDEMLDFMNYSFTNEQGKEINAQFFTMGNLLKFDTFSITEPGKYTLKMKPGFVSSKLGQNELIEITWTVSDTSGITSMTVNGTETIYYDLNGRKLNAPVHGKTVIRISTDKVQKVVY